MTDRFAIFRTLVGIVGAALLATSFVGAAAGPAFAAPIANARTV